MDISKIVDEEIEKFRKDFYNKLNSEDGIKHIFNTINTKQQEILKEYRNKLKINPDEMQNKISEITTQIWAETLSKNISESLSTILINIFNKINKN